MPRLTLCAMLGAIILTSVPTRANQTHAPQWFSDIGVGLRAGAAIREESTGESFSTDLAIGPRLIFDIFNYNNHRAVVSLDYLHLNEELNRGPLAVRVSTRYRRFDLAAGYDFVWRLLTAGAKIGAAFQVIRTRTALYDLEYEIQEVSEGNYQLEYLDRQLVDEQRKTGVDPGFLARLTVGLNLGWLLGIDQLLELRAEADYVRRDAIDSFLIGGSLVFWPTKLLKNRG